MRVYDGSTWVAAYIPAGGYLPLTGGTMTGTITFAAGQTIAGYATTANPTFTGVIGGDFSNATASSRVAFQSTTTNGATIVGAKPNGSGTASYMQVFNAADADNAAYGYMGINTTALSFNSNKTGTGTALPITFSTSFGENLRLATSGALGLAGPNYGTAGQVPVSQGAGLPPVWGDVGGGIDAVATTTSATSITLTSASAGYQSVAMTAMGKHITLPDATTMNLGGPVFIIKNDGGYPFGLRSADGNLVMGVAAGGIAYVTLKDKSTAAGSWSVVGDNLEPGLITIDSTFSNAYNASVQFPFAALDNNVSIHFARLNPSGFAAFVVDNAGGVISTPVTVDATASSAPRACFKISSTSAIVFFGNNGDNSKCVVLSLTGATPSYSLSVGSIVNIVAGGAFPSGLSTTWSGENSVGAPKIAQLTSSLYLFSATSGTNTAVAAISVSGTTVSVSTSPANIITSASATDSTTTYRLTDTTALVLYKSDTAGGAPYKNNAVVISVSGTTCTIGTSLNTGLTSQYTSPSNSTLLSATKAILADDGNATNTAKAVAVTISGTTVTAGSVLTVETASNIAGSIGQYVGNESNTRWNPHLWPIGSNTAGLWYIDSSAYVSRSVVLSESGGTLTAGTILYRSISQNSPSLAGGGVILPQGTSEYVALVNGFNSTAGAAYNLTTAKISGTAITQGASIAAVDLGSANDLLSFSAARLASGKYVLVAGNSNKAGLMCFESNGDFFKNNGSVSIPAAFYGSNVVAIPAVSANRVVLLATDDRGTTAGVSTSVLSLLNLEIAA